MLAKMHGLGRPIFNQRGIPVHAEGITNKLSLLGDNWSTSVRLLSYVIRSLVA